MARVLIVEHDPLLRSAVLADLSRRGHAVRVAATTVDGVRQLRSSPADVIVLDLALDDPDWPRALRVLRTATTAPVIMATGAGTETEVLALLTAGASDYIVRPFSCEQLAARIRAALRGVRLPAGAHAPAREQVLRVGGLAIDAARRTATLDGHPLTLSRREFDLLAFLAAKPGQVVSRRDLLTEVWHQPARDHQTIDVHLSWLRRKLGETAARPRYLRTVRGVGVMLHEPQ